MARNPELESMYAGFQKFLHQCVLNNTSLFFPEREIWTPNNLASVLQRVIGNPQRQNLSYDEKLQLQMAGASPEEWLLFAEALYVYYLPSSSIKLQTKLQNIRKTASQGGTTLPPDTAEIWAPLGIGFSRTGQRYNLRYMQVWLILWFAETLNGSSNAQQVAKDPDQVQKILDDLLDSTPAKADRAYDMRHAMLHMAFPELYEQCISTSDKEKIFTTFKDRVQEPLAADLDKALLQIRKTLAPEHDRNGVPFNFYREPLDFWRHSRSELPPVSSESVASTIKPENLPSDANAVLAALQRTRNVILYGPPGTGKTYIAKKVAQALVEPRSAVTTQSSDHFIEWVTFHQSFSYEDFVEGWRPVKGEESEQVSYDIVPGTLRYLAARAEVDPAGNYVLVIDEINRGNISKILGELITLIEDDKRKGQQNETAVTLTYSRQKFCLPSNIYIIGTMNTADRSIALLDVALRRRFAFIEIAPHAELLEDVLVGNEESSVDLGALLENLNRGIARELDRNYQLGHSYFLRIKELSDTERLIELEYVWNNQILPLLEEYFYSQREVLAEFLSGFTNSQLEQDSFEIERLTGEDLLLALKKVADS